MLCKLRLCVIYDVNYFLSKPKTGSWCHPLWFKFIVTAMSTTGNECVDKTRTSSRNNIHLFPNSVYIYIYKRQNLYIYIYIKRQNIYVCMSSHLLRNYWTEFNQFLHPPLEVHGNLNKKYLTDRSIFEIDMFNLLPPRPYKLVYFQIIFAT